MGGPTPLDCPATTPPKSVSEEWAERFDAGIVTAEELHQIELPHHALLLDTWFAEGDLGFLFAARGVGKTHLALGIARALAEGTSIGPWRAVRQTSVLYVDGEMNAEQIRDRDAALKKCSGDLYYLNHELLFERTERTLNLAKRDCQEAISIVCKRRNIKVLILDNLSTLFSGVAENENDDWEKVLPWLLDLRRHNIAVMIVHHAGRGGTHMRGASRREDSAVWVIRLEDAIDAAAESLRLRAR